MPLYEYRCQSCQHQFEVIQKFSDPPIGKCPSCGEGAVVKLFSSPAFQFKGSGWYITDYARKDAAKPSSDGNTDGKSDAKSDGKADSPGTSAKETTPSSTGAAAPAKTES
jgi:putative FmdB family regulatory protein